jgi:drug/metabolite transporter (DMT)-like permease
MHWTAASLVSAFFLGIYDLFKKSSLKDNAVVPVLFLSTVSSALVWGVLLGWQRCYPGVVPEALRVDFLTPHQHAQLLLKSLIVAASWVAGYFGLKHLPVSLASPIRATGPVWTVMGALTLLGERPTSLEWCGIATTLASFVGLSMAGRKEGIHFHRDKWVWAMIAATILGAMSSLYDKYLLGRKGYSAATVQAWFSIYLVVALAPLALGWWRRWWPRGTFHWRWSIPLIGLSLLLADYIYFNALRDPAALVSLVSSVRRGSVLVGFCGGLLFFGEKNGWAKLPAVIGVLIGILLTIR